ncbi:MAG: FAD:protein FMN transferase [Bacteroidaceae bacterium]|nr:FAD:protein FMN transferase [Bacteroidaceae bacterium]MDO5489077.1 FAD:protein FMN transferase [Bacteroidaceae bacterium]
MTDNKTKTLKKWHLPFLLFLIIGTYLAITRKEEAKDIPFQYCEGAIFGTVYHATYQCDSSLNGKILEELQAVDQSLSMFNPNSTISQINSGKSNETDSLLRTIFHIAREVSQATDGAFDITVAPLVNAWGFGFKHGALPDSLQVDSLRQLIGWNRISLKDNKFFREDPRMIIDLSAVAKGFGSDCVAQMFRKHGINNFMIEIGGEVVTSGVSPKAKAWRIGVNKPQEDSTSTSNELQTILQMNNCAMATSGNYRNFYIDNGRKIAHTIDPKTGYPVQHSILSSTVIAPTCAIADAYATAFMVLGLEKSLQVLDKHPELMAYFIHTDKEGNYQVWKSPGIEALIAQ